MDPSSRPDELCVEQPSQTVSEQLSSLIVHTAMLIGRITLSCAAVNSDKGCDEDRDEDRGLQTLPSSSTQRSVDLDDDADSECSFRSEIAPFHDAPYGDEVCGVSCGLEYRRLSMHDRHRRIEHLGAIFKIA